MLTFMRIFSVRVAKLCSKLSNQKVTTSIRLFRSGIRSTAGGRISSQYMHSRHFLKLLKAISFSHLWLSIVCLLLLNGFYLISQLVQATGISSYVHLPSLGEFCNMLSYLWALSFGWFMMVSVNHWNDIVGIYMHCHTAGDFFSTACAHLYTVNYLMLKNFLYILVTNPSMLLETVAAKEFILFSDTIHAGAHQAWLLINNHIPLYLNPLWDFIGNCASASYLWITSKIGAGVGWYWSSLTGMISLAITPIVPVFIQPYVTELFSKVASGIALSLTVWILRIFLGFPF